jgi:hypothetical protein
LGPCQSFRLWWWFECQEGPLWEICPSPLGVGTAFSTGIKTIKWFTWQKETHRRKIIFSFFQGNDGTKN